MHEDSIKLFKSLIYANSAVDTVDYEKLLP